MNLSITLFGSRNKKSAALQKILDRIEKKETRLRGRLENGASESERRQAETRMKVYAVHRRKAEAALARML